MLLNKVLKAFTPDELSIQDWGHPNDLSFGPGGCDPQSLVALLNKD